jgi:hypothetical protein
MRIRNPFSLVLSLLVTCLLASDGRPQSESKRTLYVLEDRVGRQWCAYSEEAAWRNEVQSLSAMVVATVDYANGHISAVWVTEEGESGDWIVYDHYFVTDSGAICRLERTVNVLPGDRSEKGVFLIQNGRTTKQSTASLRLTTGKPIPPSDELLPNVPVVTNVNDFPFSSLIDKKGVEAWSMGKACVKAGQS